MAEKAKVTTDKSKKIKESIKYQRDKDREMVKGIFRFYEVPGGSMSFNYRAYKGDPIERYDMVDGGVYTIPLGVAKHLNKNCNYPIHEYLRDESGNASMRVGQKVNRCGFQSLEFVDIDDLPTQTSKIVEVDKVSDDKVFRSHG